MRVCLWLCSRGAALFIYRTSLRSLALTSLTRVLHGRVLIGRNPNLCFANTINWSRITNRTNAAVLLGDFTGCGVCFFVLLFTVFMSNNQLIYFSELLLLVHDMSKPENPQTIEAHLLLVISVTEMSAGDSSSSFGGGEVVLCKTRPLIGP